MNSIVGKFRVYPLALWLLVFLMVSAAAGCGEQPPAPDVPSASLAGTPIPKAAAPISISNAARVTQLARWGIGTAGQLAYSPDGKLLAMPSSLGVYLYDAATLAQLRFLDTRAWATSVVFSADGQTLISGSNETTVTFWKVSDGTRIRTLNGKAGWAMSIALSPDGQTLATGSYYNEVQMWKVSDGSLIHTLEGHTGVIRSLAFSPDGQSLASAASYDKVRLWKVSDGTLLRTTDFVVDGEDVNSMAFSPDAKLLALPSGNTLKLWGIASGTVVQDLDAASSFNTAAFSPDSKVLAFRGKDDALELRNVSDGKLIRKLTKGGDGAVFVGLAFSPDGQTLATGAYSGTIALWKVSDGAMLNKIEGYSGLSYNPFALSSDGQTLASISWEGKVQLWKLSDGTIEKTLPTYYSLYPGIAFFPDGQTLAYGGTNGLQLWKVPYGTLIRDVKNESDISTGSAAISPDGQTVALVPTDVAGEIALLKTADGTLIRKIAGTALSPMSFSPDGQILATGAESTNENAVLLWKVSDGSLLRTLKGSKGATTSLAFSPDGKTIASGSLSSSVSLWNVSDGSLLHTLREQPTVVPEGAANPDDLTVPALAFSPDGTLLASGSSDGPIRLWKVSDGTLIGTLRGHTGSVNTLAFTGDGSMLISNSIDTTLRLWGVP